MLQKLLVKALTNPNIVQNVQGQLGSYIQNEINNYCDRVAYRRAMQIMDQLRKEKE